MSLKESEPTLHIEPRVSGQLALFLLVVHGAAIFVISVLAVPLWMQFALVGIVLVHFWISFNKHVFARYPLAIMSAIWHSSGDWTVFSTDESVHSATLLPSSYVHPKLIILNFLLENRASRSLVLCSDSITPATFRKLLVRMRLHANRMGTESEER